MLLFPFARWRECSETYVCAQVTLFTGIKVSSALGGFSFPDLQWGHKNQPFTLGAHRSPSLPTPPLAPATVLLMLLLWKKKRWRFGRMKGLSHPGHFTRLQHCPSIFLEVMTHYSENNTLRELGDVSYEPSFSTAIDCVPFKHWGIWPFSHWTLAAQSAKRQTLKMMSHQGPPNTWFLEIFWELARSKLRVVLDHILETD